MEYINHKITEVVCIIRFDPKQNIPWDSTFLGKYYELIKDKFNKKEEFITKQFNLQFKDQNISSNAIEGEREMIFKNEQENLAIILKSNYISFHALSPYPGWDVFLNDIIIKYFNFYKEIGFGNGIHSVQIIYINTFEIEKNHKLSDYLNYTYNIQGTEKVHVFNSSYDISPNKNLIIKTFLNENKVVLECNCLNLNINNDSILNLTNESKKEAKLAFENIISEKFKELIK